MSSGVYTIVNIKSNKIYIGSTQRLNRRWNEHKYMLRNNKHSNPHLQHSYNKYGLEYFKFVILKECPVDNLLDLEDYYRTAYSKYYTLYDMETKSGAPMRGRKHSIQTRTKMSKSHRHNRGGGNPDNKIKKYCEICKSHFMIYKCKLKHGNRGRFCSTDCQNKWQRRGKV